jgi:hypothetical protein
MTTPRKPPTKLPIAGKPTPAQAQRELAVKPMAATASRPEFPTRKDLYRKASLFGGAALLAGSLAACASPKPAPVEPVAAAPAPDPTPAPAPAPPPVTPSQLADDPPPPPPEDTPPPVDPALLVNGSVDGQPLAKDIPAFKVRRGGGIGPPEEMWDPSEVDAYLSWQMAHEGKLAIKSGVKLSYDGVDLALDGFDATKNIGYIYMDKMTGTADNYPADTRKKIDSWMKAKKLAILVIDQKKNPDTATLKGKIVKFLAQTKKNPPAPGPLDGATIAGADSDRAEGQYKMKKPDVVITPKNVQVKDVVQPVKIEKQ